ncbi:MAG: DUF3418 domain-containing protein, partial [Desulfobacula sp.]|nr:DUF3418 domain-containing protein [Desulfobacula sp.]
TLEHKQRKKDILASEDDMYMFYQSKLPKPFYNISTFAKFIKDQKNQNFLKMSKKDLQKSLIDDNALSLFPDTMEMEQGTFKLEYAFKPGSKKDGVTINIPADSAAGISKHKVDMLVPGLFEQKIAALIKTLPKKYRIKLVPVSQNAKIIANEMPKQNKPLFSMLSLFIQQRFNLVIPANQWSDKALPEHLKMRISIRDTKGRELKALRNNIILDEFAGISVPKKDNSFDRICKKYEKFNIKEWDFKDLEKFIIVPIKNHGKEKEFTQKYYPGLKVENSSSSKPGTQQLSLRLFKTRQEAYTSHIQGVNQLFQACHPDYFKALKKDINTNAGIKQIAPLFSGQTKFQQSLFNLITNTLFAKDFRTKKEFTNHGQKELKNLYNRGQSFIKIILELGREYQICFTLIQKLSLQYQNKKKTFAMISDLFRDLKNLVPQNFPDIYDYERVIHLHRYIACITIRAQKAADNPVKEEKKVLQLAKYNRHLNTLLSSLSQKSTKEKSRKVEEFFWLLEEYKISLFAPQIKTAIKISDKRLDKILIKLSTMI